MNVPLLDLKPQYQALREEIRRVMDDVCDAQAFILGPRVDQFEHEMAAYCGVPATLFCQHRPTEEILAFGRRIAESLRGRGILNIGDILPPDGDLEQVIALGRMAR